MFMTILVMVIISVSTGCGEVRSSEEATGSMNTSELNSETLQMDRQLAFPTAEGFGQYAKGGRGGDVYHVINLNDSGPGSLRYGIESANGPRTIVFRVAGTIPLDSGLDVDKSHLTIAGQTAPGGGITLRNYTLNVEADHVIIRYIRVRLGDRGSFSAGGRDAIDTGVGSHINLDHCSASWSFDETLSSTRTDSLTIQWCIIAESLHNSLHPKGPHGYGGILSANSASYHHNLYAHHMRRTPNVSFRNYIRADYRNNVIYNWGDLSSYRGTSAHANWVNNYYKPGPATLPEVRRQIFQFELASPGKVPDIEPKFYIEGNYMHGYPEISADNWNGGMDYRHGLTEERVRARKPFDYPKLRTEQTPQEAYIKVLESAGASIARDPVDARIVGDVLTGSYTYGRYGFIDTQDEVGGWPQIHPMGSPADSDWDGMPDWWEGENGLDAGEPADGNSDQDGDGYTNLEEFLNWKADPQGRFMEHYPEGRFSIPRPEAPRKLFD